MEEIELIDIADENDCVIATLMNCGRKSHARRKNSTKQHLKL